MTPSAANDNQSDAQRRQAAGRRAYLRHDFDAVGCRPGDDWEHLLPEQRAYWIGKAAETPAA